MMESFIRLSTQSSMEGCVLRTVIGLQAVVSKFASFNWPTFSSQCLSLKRRAVFGREAMFEGW